MTPTRRSSKAPTATATIDDDEVILRDRELPDEHHGRLRRTTQNRAIFLPTGFPRIETANVNRFVLCDVRGNVASAGGDSAARLVEVLPTGRPSVSRSNATITSSEAAHDPQPRRLSRIARLSCIAS